MIRGWITTCLGVWAAVAAAGTGHGQAPSPVTGRPVRAGQGLAPGYPTPTPGLMAPAPSVPPRTSYQPSTAPPVPPDQQQLVLPQGVSIPVPDAVSRQFRFTRRYINQQFNYTVETLPDKVTRRVLFTGGLIVNVNFANGQLIEFATDEAVVWIRGGGSNNILGGFESRPGDKTEVEVYLTGNVIVRTMSSQGQFGSVTQTVRAEQVYYDVSRSRMIAVGADLEMGTPKLPDGAHLRGREIRRLDENHWEVLDGSMFSSKLPSDPGLRLDSPRMSLTETKGIRRNIFGIPYRDMQTGEKIMGVERLVTLRNAVTRLGGVPVFYTPYLRTDATEPLGPFLGLGFGQDRIFGTQVYTNWDVYKILALKPPPGHNWRMDLDYLSDRGPAAGTEYNYTLQPREPGQFSPGRGNIRLYGINDGGVDVVGNGRGPEPVHPQNRGRIGWRHVQDLNNLVDGLTFQGQVAYISDKNFLEQFYRQEWEQGSNQETFAYLDWQRQNYSVSGLVMPRMSRPWIAQTEWYPRFDGSVVGQSFWDTLVYNADASAAYAQARPSQINPGPVLPTDRQVNTGRLDLMQELSLPVELGPVKVAPYGVLDLSYYSQDLTGNDRGRVLGGGGVRSSLPLSRLYADAASDLFNIKGLYHKVVFGTNYYNVWSNTPYTQLPLLDRLNDDAIDQAYRNAVPFEPDFVPGPNGQLLKNSASLTTPTPFYNPQLYAIRRLVDNRIDTRDSMQVLQGEVRQRLQTKRGYPGLEHTVDLLSLNVSASWFPQANRDNFGKQFAFLEYNGLWNVGDRVAVLSNGWFEPYQNGVRYYNIGGYLDRPDRTSYYLGYRQTDPLNSKQVTFSVGYQFSRRYNVNMGTSYDFGMTQALTNTFSLTRTGSDMTVSIGFTYNALVNNFGFQFLIVPNLLNYLTPGKASAVGPGSFAR